jgi:carbon-monoxide dehydrogenase small subunit/xanthine dehydrogenase small subunit
MKINLTVNSNNIWIECSPMKSLLHILREDLHLTGAKEGCGEGECGACAVIVDGMLMNSCMVPAVQLPGKDVLTVEGLGTTDEPDILQRAFVEEGAVQCGFCTPGMVMASRFLLSRNPHPDRESIKLGLAGNLCRCTGYEDIFRAVERAAEEGYGESVTTVQYPSTPGPFELDENEKGHIYIPLTIEDALSILKDRGKNITLLAGTTDMMVQLKNGGTIPEDIMDISRIPELTKISMDENHIEIGSCCTYSNIYNDLSVTRHYPALEKAARSNGAITLQNRATIGGNLMTASPAADMPPILMALGAKAVLRSSRGARELDITELLCDYRRTSAEPDEILTAIRIPRPGQNSRQAYYKRGSRAMLTIARISLGAYTEIGQDGTLRQPRFAVGTMGKTAYMLGDLQDYLQGKILTRKVASEAGNLASTIVNPRKTPEYRKDVTGNLVRDFLMGILNERS